MKSTIHGPLNDRFGHGAHIYTIMTPSDAECVIIQVCLHPSLGAASYRITGARYDGGLPLIATVAYPLRTGDYAAIIKTLPEVAESREAREMHIGVLLRAAIKDIKQHAMESAK